MLDDFAINNALDPQEHEADLPARGRDTHERSLMGCLYGHNARNELVFAQFSLNSMAHIGKGSPHVR